jgi:hypothetical protein
MAAGFQVYFRSESCDLNTAVRALEECGLTVRPQEGYVTVSRTGSPEFDVGLSTEPWVRFEAAEVSAGTPHADAMGQCDARFEVSFESLDAALDEINTMIEIQVALQEACNGYQFLSWNGNLSGPGQSQ